MKKIKAAQWKVIKAKSKVKELIRSTECVGIRPKTYFWTN